MQLGHCKDCPVGGGTVVVVSSVVVVVVGIVVGTFIKGNSSVINFD